MLLLENIYKFIKKNDVSGLDKTIMKNLKKIEKVIEEFSLIKNKYLDMESNIKKSLDDYYGVIRDAEYKMKEQFNNIWDSIVDDDNKLIKYTDKEEIIKSAGKKIQTILDKTLSKFNDSNNYKFIINDDGNINILYKLKSICVIVMYKLKIVIRFLNYDMTLSGINDDTKLLDAYLMKTIIMN